MSDIVFYIIAFLTCLFGLLTVTSKNVFHSAVWLTMCLISIAGIYFYLNAQFIGVIQILVYIGGIITLFIFAIKLTAHIEDSTIRQTNEQLIPSLTLAIAFFILLFSIIVVIPWAPGQMKSYFSLEDLGRSLLTTYVLPFEFISIMLLAVMVGAIVIGKGRS